MLKGNLSNRPFYNENLAMLAVALFALAAAALTAYNATELVRLSSERSATVGHIDRDQAEAARIRADAAALQQTVDRAQLARLAGASHEANNIIDQRMFSWTGFFRLIEKTLPMDVRVVMVSPRAESGTFKVAIDVVAKSLSDVANFIAALGNTGAFYDVAAVNQQRNDNGTISATIEAAYLARPEETSPAPAPPAVEGKKP